MLSALDYQVIRKVQHIIWNPGNQPYQTLKQALIKLYKISDDNRLDRLVHQTDLGDCKPTELLSELRTLLGESCNVGTDLDKLLRKLFLDRLPPQVRLILAGSPQPTLDLMAQRADDIMATIATTPSLNSNPTQLLQNQIFERRLDQLTGNRSLFIKKIILALLIATSNFTVHRTFIKQGPKTARALNFSHAAKCHQLPGRTIASLLDPQSELLQKIFASSTPALAIKLATVERHVLGSRVSLMNPMIQIIIDWHLTPATLNRGLQSCTVRSLSFTTPVLTCVFFLTRALTSI